jgi:hypothetical protein
MYYDQKISFSNGLRRVICFLLASALLASFAGLVSPGQVRAASPDAPIEYNKVMTRYYKSSIDGVTLPCRVYVPNKGR